MNSRDPFHEIGDLLRSHKPDPQPSPGLEARIVRQLVTREPSLVRRVWPWFLLPPAVAAGIVLMWPAPGSAPTVTYQEPPAPAVLEVPPPPADNPLEKEALALHRDARRAGRFLIDCLPSLDLAGD